MYALQPMSRLNATYRNLTAWTFQSWLAMFFIAAAFAKLTEPATNLDILLGWNRYVDPDVVRWIGNAELVLGLGVLAPLFSWRWGGPIMVAALAIVIAAAIVMAIVHGLMLDPGLVVVNVILASLAIATLKLRQKRQPKRASAKHYGTLSPAPLTLGTGR